MSDEPLKRSDWPIFQTKKVGDEQFIAIRKEDTEKSSVHVVGSDGLNYGAWRDIDNFVDAYKLGKTLKPGEQSNELVALPLGSVRLSIRVIN